MKRAIAFQCRRRASAPAAATSTTAVRASAGSTAKRSTIVLSPLVIRETHGSSPSQLATTSLKTCSTSIS